MAIKHLKYKNYSLESLSVLYSAFKLMSELEGQDHPEIQDNMEAIQDEFGDKSGGLAGVEDYMAVIEVPEIAN